MKGMQVVHDKCWNLIYEDCSGQIINKNKSSMLFSKNCGQAQKAAFMSELDLSQEARSDK